MRTSYTMHSPWVLVGCLRVTIFCVRVFVVCLLFKLYFLGKVLLGNVRLRIRCTMVCQMQKVPMDV